VVVTHGATGNTATTCYAFGGQTDILALARIGKNLGRLEEFFFRLVKCEDLLVFLEERIHVYYKVLDYGKVVERSYGDFLAGRDIRDICLAGQAFLAVNHHSARPTHIDPAGIPESKSGILFSLNAQEHVENRGPDLVGNFQCVALKITRAPRVGVIAEYSYVAYAAAC
jgi:hypothetical protein